LARQIKLFKIVKYGAYMNIKILISIILTIILISLMSCAETDTSTLTETNEKKNAKGLSGTIVEPSILLNLVGGKQKEKILPLKIWEWNGTQQLVTTPSGGVPPNMSNLKMKANMCVLEHTSVINEDLSIGSSVRVIEEAECEWVLYMGDGALKKYNVGIMKIEIISTGSTGWTWSTSVEST